MFIKHGKQAIYEQPLNDLTELGPYADQFQREAQARGEVLAPPTRLHIGEPDFRTPEHIRQAAVESMLSEPQNYGPAAGHYWLRELLAEKIQRINQYQAQPQQIAVTAGGTNAIQAALTATVGPGDEILIPDPCWATYYMQLLACGVTGVSFPLDPQRGWLPDIEALEQLVTPRTRMLLINTPCNPTGAVYPRAVIEQLLEFARRHDLYLLSDECYDELIFEGEHFSPARLMTPEELETGRFIGIYTFSKTYAMTGWRVGYVVAGSKLMKTIVDVLNGSHTNICTALQRAAAAALTGPQDCLLEMRNHYRRRRDLVIELLKQHNRYVYTPQGAFYALVDTSGKDGHKRHSRQFTLDFLQASNVLVAPGSAFGSVAENYVRISLAASEKALIRGIHELCIFADQ